MYYYFRKQILLPKAKFRYKITKIPQNSTIIQHNYTDPNSKSSKSKNHKPLNYKVEAFVLSCIKKRVTLTIKQHEYN